MPKVVTDTAVYEAVVQTVMQRGYAGATTKQIAELAGVNEATLFRKYGSKRQLVQQAVAALIEAADIESFVYYSGDVEADLLRIVAHFFEKSAVNGPLFTALISELGRIPELREVVMEPEPLMMHLGRVLAQYQADGVLRQEHPLHAVAALFGPIMMVRMIAYANPDTPWPPLDVAAHVANYLGGRRLTT